MTSMVKQDAKDTLVIATIVFFYMIGILAIFEFLFKVYCKIRSR